MRSVIALAIGMAMSSGATAAAAQQHDHDDHGVLDGVITDSSLAPIAGATASILGSSLHVTTGSNGRFRIVSLAPGQYLLAIHRLGYIASSTSIVIGATDTLRLSFTLAPIMRVLDTVPVVAKRLVGRLAEFDDRRRLGQGYFMTQEQIEKLNVTMPRDLLAMFSAVDATGTFAVARKLLPAMSCPYQFFVDGVKLPFPTSLDFDLPSPKEIAGMEVYPNSAVIPLQYKTTSGGGFCGVVLIWTRSGV